MHQGFRQEEWVVERTPVNTPETANDKVCTKVFKIVTTTGSKDGIYILSMKELFLITITKPPEVIVKDLSLLCLVLPSM